MNCFKHLTYEFILRFACTVKIQVTSFLIMCVVLKWLVLCLFLSGSYAYIPTDIFHKLSGMEGCLWLKKD